MDQKSVFVQEEGLPGTFDKDDSLPPLPLPKLDDTLERYFESLKPFATADELKQTQKIIEEFKNGEGRKLHALLEEKAKCTKNWLEDWWEKYAYLSLRLPLLPCCLMVTTVIGESIGIREKPDHFLKTAALLSYQTLQFWQLIRNERLKPFTNPDGSITFSSNLFRRLYNTIRVPGVEIDQVVSYFKTKTQGDCPSHIIVIGNGRYFILQGTHKDGRILNVSEFYKQLQIINSELLENQDNARPFIPLLTQDDRTNWAKNRLKLMEISENNKASLELIESAICVLSIDDRSPGNYSEAVQISMTGGTSIWADKSAALIMFRNGMLGCLAEHTCFDGSVSAMTNFFIMLGLIEMSDVNWEEQPETVVVPKELKFDLNATLITEIKRMEGVHEENLDSVSVVLHTYQTYGKEFMKSLKIHPDAFLQCVLQLTYHHLHEDVAATYETATMREYYRGRTETVRSCNVDMAELCKSWNNKTTESKEKQALFRKAALSQHNLMKEARKGRGVDRHLFGLWCTAYDNNLPIPALYEDPLYAKSGGGGNFVLSTSTLGYTINIGCVAPMVLDGYGVFYSMLRDCCWLLITTYKASTKTSAEKFRQSFDTVMDEVKTVFEQNELLVNKL